MTFLSQRKNGDTTMQIPSFTPQPQGEPPFDIVIYRIERLIYSSASDDN